jgi:hypothetical protein
MDYLEGFLIGSIWSDTDYRTRRHYHAHVFLATLMAAAFAFFLFFPVGWSNERFLRTSVPRIAFLKLRTVRPSFIRSPVCSVIVRFCELGISRFRALTGRYAAHSARFIESVFCSVHVAES